MLISGYGKEFDDTAQELCAKLSLEELEALHTVCSDAMMRHAIRYGTLTFKEAGRDRDNAFDRMMHNEGTRFDAQEPEDD